MLSTASSMINTIAKQTPLRNTKSRSKTSSKVRQSGQLLHRPSLPPPPERDVPPPWRASVSASALPWAPARSSAVGSCGARSQGAWAKVRARPLARVRKGNLAFNIRALDSLESVPITHVINNVPERFVYNTKSCTHRDMTQRITNCKSGSQRMDHLRPPCTFCTNHVALKLELRERKQPSEVNSLHNHASLPSSNPCRDKWSS